MSHGPLKSHSDELIISRDRMPVHVAIIMDGNGRWALRQYRPRVFGHRRGYVRVREAVEAACELEIEAMTLFAFSEENWSRPKAEVNTIMGLLSAYLAKETATLKEKNIRLRAIGDLGRLPSKCQELLANAIEVTSDNTGLNLTLALSYGARSEMAGAARRLAERVKAGTLDVKDISQETFESELETRELPPVDLLIRTSGELRISNFLLWQIAYAELFFSPVFWPEFTRAHLLEAIVAFQQRQRRFGRVMEESSIVASSKQAVVKRDSGYA